MQRTYWITNNNIWNSNDKQIIYNIEMKIRLVPDVWHHVVWPGLLVTGYPCINQPIRRIFLNWTHQANTIDWSPSARWIYGPGLVRFAIVRPFDDARDHFGPKSKWQFSNNKFHYWPINSCFSLLWLPPPWWFMQMWKCKISDSHHWWFDHGD